MVEHLFIIYTVLGSGNIMINKTGKLFAFLEIIFQEEGE